MKLSPCASCEHLSFKEVESTPQWMQIGDNQPFKVMPYSTSEGYCKKDLIPINYECSEFVDYIPPTGVINT